MIALLLCDCGGAELRGRDCLRSCGMKDYLEPKASWGKKACLDFLSNFPNDNREAKLARGTVNNFSSYCIAFGYKSDGSVMWVDFQDSAPTTMFDGEILVENYA